MFLGYDSSVICFCAFSTEGSVLTSLFCTYQDPSTANYYNDLSMTFAKSSQSLKEINDLI